MCYNNIKLIAHYKDRDIEADKKYLETLELIKKKYGTCHLTDRINKIKKEIIFIKNFKNNIINKIQNNLNIKNKHVKNINKKFIKYNKTPYGLMRYYDIFNLNENKNNLNLIDYNLKFFENKLTKNKLTFNKKTRKMKGEYNRYKNELLIKSMLSEIIDECDYHINFYKFIITNLIKKPHTLNKKIYTWNDINTPFIIHINELNRNKIILDDHYDIIYLIKNIHYTSYIKHNNKIMIGNGYILCKSKKLRGSKWNIFPCAEKLLGKINYTNMKNIKKYNEFESIENIENFKDLNNQ